jgi:hypothetical protein
MLATVAKFDGAAVKLWDPTSGELLHCIDGFNSVGGEITFFSRVPHGSIAPAAHMFI